jgi:hypothetical protein
VSDKQDVEKEKYDFQCEGGGTRVFSLQSLCSLALTLLNGIMYPRDLIWRSPGHLGTRTALKKDLSGLPSAGLPQSFFAQIGVHKHILTILEIEIPLGPYLVSFSSPIHDHLP